MGDQDTPRDRLREAYPALRRFAAVVGPPDVEPDDLVQDAFVRVLRRGFDGIDDLDAYLRRTVLHLGSNHRRDWSRRQKAFARRGADPAVATSPSYVDAADLLRLEPEVRAVLWLAEVEGWSYGEIGTMLACSEGAARMRAARGRRLLRAQLEEEAR
jgi:DNA-directed RNA polymerase specialized sigma24 family protein